ncbi:coiled-coil domain-containing protein [Helicobacter pylori]|uniref:coiled-coil domain-containing protein n=1 Tax=Helicobacter pylori TaxID=210 RepID=UPI000415233D
MNELKNSQQVLNNEKIEWSREKNDLTAKITELSTAKNDLLKTKENLTKANADLKTEKEKLNGQNEALTETNQKLTAEKESLLKKLENDKQVLNNEKIELTKENENLNTDLSNAKSQLSQTSQKLNELERKHAPYTKLEKLYEVFLEVKECLIFEFVKDTHSTMDLIGYVLSDSKYYVEEFYKKTQQELRNKNSDKGEKFVALFDLLFECIKDKKFKRLEAPSSYNSACITLYPEQSSTGNIQRVVLRGYSYNDAIKPSIVDMGG